MLDNAVPKPTPRWQLRQRDRAAEARAMQTCYAAVDARDRHCCRVCGRRVLEGRPMWAAVEARFKELARQHHPDVGGDPVLMAKLNAARDAARLELEA